MFCPAVNVKLKLIFYSCAVDFPTPKTELVQKFHVQYLGMLPVVKPVGMSHFSSQLSSNLSFNN